MDLVRKLDEQFAARQARNSCYSLRAFAWDLGIDHSALSKILRRRRPVTPRVMRLLGTRLGFEPAEIEEACLNYQADAVLRRMSVPGFRTDIRWIAERTGLPIDAVNIALNRLLIRGDLRMASAGQWSSPIKVQE